MLSVAIQPMLSYGCSTLNADRNVKELAKAQAKLLKLALSLPKFVTTHHCYHSVILSLALKKVAKTLQAQQLSL